MSETADKIKKGLGIEGIETEESAWRYVPGKAQSENGAQIDLLIDRKDRNINICEMKSQYAARKDYFVLNTGGFAAHPSNSFHIRICKASTPEGLNAVSSFSLLGTNYTAAG